MVSYAACLARLAGEAPDRLAVTDDDRSLTRRELEDLADRTARAFAASGVSAGDRVTIALRNTAGFLAAAIGCWKLGATPAPVSWRLPRRELDALVELTDPKIVLGCEPAPTRDVPACHMAGSHRPRRRPAQRRCPTRCPIRGRR